MAATHPEVALPIDARPGRRLRRLITAVLGLAGIAALLAAAAAAAWVGYEAAYAGRVVPGVTVAGLDLSGSTEADALRLIRDRLGDRFDGRLVLAVTGHEFEAAYRDVGRTLDADATLAAAMAVGRTGEPLARLQERMAVLGGGVAVEPVLRFDPLPLRAWLDTLGGQLDVPARAASVAWGSAGAVFTADEPGARFDRRSVAAEAEATLAQPGATQSLSLDGRLVRVEADRTDVDALRTVLLAERLVQPFTLKAGIRTWTVEAADVPPWITLRDTPRGQVPALDLAAVGRGIPGVVGKTVKREPVETAILVTRGGREVGFVAGKPGRHLDRATTAARIAAALAGPRPADGTPALVRVAASPVALERTDEEVAGGLPELIPIGSWTTSYPVSERNGFGANITIPAQLIDGTYLPPGQTFDFWGAIGPVTYARGFRDGAIIVGGRSQPTGAIAGGICSASTTLFNAAARAGLQILERDNHYYYIDRYPLGLDATVSKLRGRIAQNMRFRNDTAHPIFIRGNAGPGWVRFTLYSRPNGREVSFSTPQVWNVVPARDATVLTSTLPAGTTKRLEYPVQGMNVLVTRTVRENGRVIHRDEFFTRYGKVDGILQVGTG